MLVCTYVYKTTTRKTSTTQQNELTRTTQPQWKIIITIKIITNYFITFNNFENVIELKQIRTS